MTTTITGDTVARFQQAHAANLADVDHQRAHLNLAFGFLMGAQLPGCASALAIAWGKSDIGGMSSLVEMLVEEPPGE